VIKVAVYLAVLTALIGSAGYVSDAEGSGQPVISAEPGAAGRVEAVEAVKVAGGSEPGGRSWSFFLYRGRGRTVQSPLCLVGKLTLERTGGRESVTSESPVCHSPGTPGFWLLTGALGLTGPPRRILVVVLPARATRVQLVRSSGGSVTRKPVRLAPSEAASIKSGTLGVVVSSDRPGMCFSALRVLDRGGHLLGRRALAPC